MRRNWYGIIALIAVATLIGAACDQGASTPSEEDGGGIQTVYIGFEDSLTGDFATYGNSLLDAAKLAVTDINKNAEANGFRIELVVKDDRTDPKQGPINAQDFCDDSRVLAVTGWSWSTILLANMPIFTQCGMPVVDAGASNPTLSGSSPYFHRTVLSDAITGVKLAEYGVNNLQAGSVAVFNSNDDYGKGVGDAIANRAEELGATVELHEQYPVGTKDFRAQVTKLGDANVDLVFLGGFYGEAAAIVRQAREVGVTAQFLGSQGVRAQDFIDLAGDAAEGTIHASEFETESSDPVVQSFADAFEATYNRPPDTFGALEYDAMLAIAEALRSTEEFSREAVNAALKQVSTDGVTGHISFDELGDNQHDLLFVKVENGEFVLV